jgi:hypothetical protein
MYWISYLLSIAQVVPKDQSRSEAILSVAQANETTVIIVYTQLWINHKFKYLNWLLIKHQIKYLNKRLINYQFKYLDWLN